MTNMLALPDCPILTVLIAFSLCLKTYLAFQGSVHVATLNGDKGGGGGG